MDENMNQNPTPPSQGQPQESNPPAEAPAPSETPSKGVPKWVYVVAAVVVVGVLLYVVMM